MADRFAVIDVETSGLSARRHRLLQIAVVTTDGSGRVLSEWSTYVRRRFAPVGPTEIHGITRSTVRRAPRFSDVMGELVGQLDGATIVAHNAQFDWAFVRRALRRAGYRVPDARRICTLRLSRQLDPERLVRHRLGDLCERYGVPLVNAHDALTDARATAGVLPWLLTAAGDRVITATDGSATEWPRPPTSVGPLRRYW